VELGNIVVMMGSESGFRIEVPGTLQELKYTCTPSSCFSKIGTF